LKTTRDKHKKLNDQFEKLNKALFAQKELVTTKYNELEKFKDDHKVKEVNETTEVQKVKTEMGGLKTRLQFADQAKNDA
jgi:hypothetical protein